MCSPLFSVRDRLNLQQSVYRYIDNSGRNSCRMVSDKAQSANGLETLHGNIVFQIYTVYSHVYHGRSCIRLEQEWPTSIDSCDRPCEFFQVIAMEKKKLSINNNVYTYVPFTFILFIILITHYFTVLIYLMVILRLYSKQLICCCQSLFNCRIRRLNLNLI